MSYHAKRSPSGAKRWSTCTASISEEAGRKDTAGSAAEWGTAAHLVSETCLIDEFGMTNPVDFLGQIVIGWIHPESDSRGESIHTLDGDLDLGQEVLWSVPIDDELVECATKYVDFIRDLVSTTDGRLHVEVKVPIDHITGEEGATGTSDAVIDAPGETIVGDLKGGMMQVDAWELGEPDLFSGEPTFKPNPQLAMYADGALTKLRPDLLAVPDHPVRLVIVQPRLNHISE